MLSAAEHPMWTGHTDWTMIAGAYGRRMPLSDIAAGSKAETFFHITTSIKITEKLGG